MDAHREGNWLSWRWVAGGALGALAIGGLFVARLAASEPTYVLGIAVACAATLAVYTLIATAYGPSPFDEVAGFDPLPANGMWRWAAGTVVGALALGALFHARDRAGLGHDAALGLFVVAALYDFLLIKDWFDRQGRRRP
jgi:hypothetical protein